MTDRAPDRPVAPSQSAIRLLADPICRATIVALGELGGAESDGLVLTEAALAGASPRLIQSRARELDRFGIVRSSAPGANQPRRWRLTEAGLDLFRLQTLLARVVLRASQRPSATPAPLRDSALDGVLGGLADPITTRLCLALALAGGPVGPVSLEEQCAPVPRRTLYRRLGALVDAGVVERRSGHTVPRTTFYNLADAWRPAAVVLVLASWWEARHWEAPAPAATDAPAAILAAVVPLARIGTEFDGKTVVCQTDRGEALGLVVKHDRLSTTAPPSAPDVVVLGSSEAWCAAMVTDHRERLQLTGDAALAQAVITSVRTALLAYVR